MEDLRSVLSRDKVVHQLMWASLCLGASGSSHVSGEAGHKAGLTCVTCMCLWGWEGGQGKEQGQTKQELWRHLWVTSHHGPFSEESTPKWSQQNPGGGKNWIVEVPGIVAFEEELALPNVHRNVPFRGTWSCFFQQRQQQPQHPWHLHQLAFCSAQWPPNLGHTSGEIQRGKSLYSESSSPNQCVHGWL